MIDIEAVAADAVDCGLHLHRKLGPGLLESVYENVLAEQLRRRGHVVAQQVAIDIDVDGIIFNGAFRADLVVNKALIIEIKSVEKFVPVHAKQLLTYLRLSELTIGLLMNFGAETFRDGLKRLVNNHPFAPSRLRAQILSPSSSDQPHS